MSVKNPRWSERELPEFFLEWRRRWQGPSVDTMTPVNYLDEQGAVRFVIASAWLFCPETTEYRGCIFLREGFDQEIIDNWFTHFDGEQEPIEAVVNQAKLYDLFGNTDLDPYADDLVSLAQAVGECWQGVLSSRYPGRGVTVEYSGDADGAYGPTVTFWTAHPRS
jgi:hypothetical protein